VTCVDPAQLPQVLSLQVTSGVLADLTTGAIAVSREAATTLGLAVGSPVTVRTARGARVLTVRAVYDTATLDDFARQQLRWPTSWSPRPTTGRWPASAA
jgi:hypothetical protein